MCSGRPANCRPYSSVSMYALSVNLNGTYARVSPVSGSVYTVFGGATSTKYDFTSWCEFPPGFVVAITLGLMPRRVMVSNALPEARRRDFRYV